MAVGYRQWPAAILNRVFQIFCCDPSPLCSMPFILSRRWGADRLHQYANEVDVPRTLRRFAFFGNSLAPRHVAAGQQLLSRSWNGRVFFFVFWANFSFDSCFFCFSFSTGPDRVFLSRTKLGTEEAKLMIFVFARFFHFGLPFSDDFHGPSLVLSLHERKIYIEISDGEPVNKVNL